MLENELLTVFQVSRYSPLSQRHAGQTLPAAHSLIQPQTRMVWRTGRVDQPKKRY